MTSVPRLLAWAAALGLCIANGCGFRSHDDCPAGKHSADPDGHGSRCIDDASTCDQVSDCAAQSECCVASCGDATGSGVYSCTESCRSPECDGDESCGPGWRCEDAFEACGGRCVPEELYCAEDEVAADPDGDGQFDCIDRWSTCFAASDCVGLGSECCEGVCLGSSPGGHYECDLLCAGDDWDGDVWTCTTDDECAEMTGEVGWTCDPGGCWGNVCNPPQPECETAADCVIAYDMSLCCNCGDAYSWDEIWADPCLAPEGGRPEADPPGGGVAPAQCPDVCDAFCDIDCGTPAGVECTPSRQCVAVW